MITKKDKEERESALVSLFAIHQTKDPENVIRGAMDKVLETYHRRTLSQHHKELMERVERLPNAEVEYQVKHGSTKVATAYKNPTISTEIG